MAFVGVVTRKRMYKRSPSGLLTFTGSVGTGTSLKRSIGGIVAFVGDITSLASQRLLEGALRFSGVVTRVINGTPVGGSLRHRNDCVSDALGGGQYNELLLGYYQSNGASSYNLHDAEAEFLIAQGALPSSNADMWIELLTGLGFTGSLSDMLTEFWCGT